MDRVVVIRGKIGVEFLQDFVAGAFDVDV